MKYIITESKAKKIVFEAIKDKIDELNLYRSEFDSFIVYSTTVEFDDLGMKSVLIEYDFSDGRLYVDLEPFQFILSMYGFDSNDEELKKLFMDWFEHYEGIKPDYVDF